ncbi:tetratricopeptide repeat protein [Thermospira aquatica]|uniref:Tetratricopeptide repeat protein n=1 Tax=Thermospira aquatica TaxID=2828656 RepID=A0AAX3BGL0_9SPIR|nr:tetratricopeptide repeat protein [Thermospira aquatica]URA11298.1 tetratricopeptide repeat protein [Thermospira aquatica]
MRWKIFFFLMVCQVCQVWAKESLSSQVRELLKVSNYQEARRLVQEKIQKQPDIASHYILLSQIYREEGKYSNAYFVALQAYRDFPQNPWVAKELADVYRGLGVYRKALGIYEKFLPEVDEKQRPLWYYGMGVCYFEIEDYPGLLFWGLYYLGRTYLAQAKSPLALWAFERAELELRFQPDWATNLLYYQWGVALIEYALQVKTTNQQAAKQMFVTMLKDKRFTDRRVRERVEFWEKRL